MPEAFTSDLDDQTRHKMIDLLNARLADLVSLTLAVKQAHWNLKGPGYKDPVISACTNCSMT